MNISATQHDGAYEKPQMVLAVEEMLVQLRRRASTDLSKAGDMAVKAVVNSYYDGQRDHHGGKYDSQGELRDALEKHGETQGYLQALQCFEQAVPEPNESFVAYQRRMVELIQPKEAEHVTAAGELALHAISFTASHPEYGPARAAAVRAAALADGLRRGATEALELINKLVTQDNQQRVGG